MKNRKWLKIGIGILAILIILFIVVYLLPRPPSVVVVDAPATAETGSPFKITWRVNSNLDYQTNHTAIHYGPESKSEPLTITSYSNISTVYTGLIPATLSTNITINTPGVIYFRAHVIINNVNYWSDEKSIVVSEPPPPSTPTIGITDAPATAETGSPFKITWRVNSNVDYQTDHTAIHYGPESESEPLTITSYSNISTVYTGLIPATLSTNITINTPGVIYFRAHVIINNVNYWSDEKSIVVSELPPAVTQLKPAVGSVFSYIPHMITLEWKAVPGATNYMVEVQDCSDKGCDLEATTHSFNVTDTSYTFDFVWAKPGYMQGRWRVWAVNANGKAGPKSSWSDFRYTSQDVILVSPSGNVTVTIFSGTNAIANNTSLPLTSISIDSPAKIPPRCANLDMGGKPIENLSLGPDGARFIPDVQIRFNYTDETLAVAGASTSLLSIKFCNTNTNLWENQTLFNNETGRYIIANTSHFSFFSLVAVSSIPRPTQTVSPIGSVPTATSSIAASEAGKPAGTTTAPATTITTALVIVVMVHLFAIKKKKKKGKSP